MRALNRFQNVFVTGAPSQLPEILPRLHNAMRPILPPEMPLNIVRASDPTLDAWRGMAECALNGNYWSYAVTKEEYEANCDICFSPPRSGERRANVCDLRPVESNQRHAQTRVISKQLVHDNIVWSNPANPIEVAQC